MRHLKIESKARVSTLAFAAAALALASFLLVFPVPTRAQAPSLPAPPFNVDQGAVITNTNATSGTTNTVGTVNGAAPSLSNQGSNLANQGVVCVFTGTASSSSTSTTFALQMFDAASNAWSSLLTSSAIVMGPAITAPVLSVLAIRPSMAVASLPTNWAAQNVPLPRTWRVQQVIAGTGIAQAITGTIGCNLVR